MCHLATWINLRNCRITDIQPKRIRVLRFYAYEGQDQEKPTCGRRNQNDGLSLVKMMILAQCERCFWHFSLFNCYCSFRNMVLLWEFINCTLKICVLFYMYTAAAAAKSLQSCLTLCDPIDGSPPGSPVPGILQARSLEWVAIYFSNAWKWKVKGKSLSRVWLFMTPWAAAHQAPPTTGFSRQEYWSGVPSPSPICVLDFNKMIKLDKSRKYKLNLRDCPPK